MSQESSKINDFLAGKPTIQSVEQSSLFSRLRSFLPQMEEANRNMPDSSEQTSSSDAFQIVNKNDDDEEETSSSSSSSESDSEGEEDGGAERGNEQNMKKKKKTKKAEEAGDRIEIDLDVFLEKNSAVDGRDVSVQAVETLPEAFHSEDVVEPPRKPLIEEM